MQRCLSSVKGLKRDMYELQSTGSGGQILHQLRSGPDCPSYRPSQQRVRLFVQRRRGPAQLLPPVRDRIPPSGVTDGWAAEPTSRQAEANFHLRTRNARVRRIRHGRLGDTPRVAKRPARVRTPSEIQAYAVGNIAGLRKVSDAFRSSAIGSLHW